MSEFLAELSIGVHRHAMYPPSHPSLVPVVENILGRLDEIFEGRRTLSIGVAQRQLVIEGVATDQRNPVLAEFARRLHDHQLGAISIEKGMSASEISGLLAALAREPDRDGPPLGLLPSEQMPRWDHAHLYRLGYERLEIREGEGRAEAARATALWLGLAQAALATEEPLEVVPDAVEVARSISSHREESAYEQSIVGYLLQLTDELKEAAGGESEAVRRRVSKLVEELDDDTLRRLVHFGGDAAQRRNFLLDANASLAAESVVKVLDAAARGSEQSISNSMTRLLTKLAVHAEYGTGAQRSQADTALRENVEALIEGWELRDPNPEAYTSVLDAMSRAAPIFEEPKERGSALPGAQRLVEMALELDAWGPMIAKALQDLAREGDIKVLLTLLKGADVGSGTAARMRRALAMPEHVTRILSDEHWHEKTSKALLTSLGDVAIGPLLDVLAECDDPSMVRRLHGVLAGLGPTVGERAVARLRDGRWIVVRNMLALLARAYQLPEGLDLRPLIDHEDPRVRHAALPVALGVSHLRERALVDSLADPDERLVRLALRELDAEVPDVVLPTLVYRVVMDDGRSAELREMGVKVLQGSRSLLALITLIELVTPGRTLFGRKRFAPTSPEVVQGLRVLAACWSDRPDVQEILEQAARSGDEEIRRALEGLDDAPRSQGGSA